MAGEDEWVSWEEFWRADEAAQTAMRALPTWELRRHAAISPWVDGDSLVTASVGPDGEVIGLWSAPSGEAALRSRTTQPGWASFPDPMAPQPVEVRVTQHTPEPALLAQISDLRVAHPLVQPLPGGNVLIAGARSRWRPAPDGPDKNAFVYDADGHLIMEGLFGDGIKHMLAAATGDIWVGYFDEGVYGNYGWGGPGPAPVGGPA